MGIIYMPNSAPLPPPPPPPKPKPPPNIPLLVGGATGSLATVGVAISAKNWLWQNMWIIVLAIFILASIAYALWKAFKAKGPDKEDEPEEE
jgi:4-hydroxybenzoate polyprenyltransferase